MRSFFIDISGVERKNRNFPPVSKIFCSQEYVAHRVTPVKKNFFEICLRLESESPVCHDIVNNEKISAAYPNCVWKKPMQTFAICDKSSRESIAFLWAPEAETFFSSNGLIPEKGFCHFAMNNDIQFLVRKFYRLVNNIYFPGVADQVDWLALCICREIIFASSNCKNEISMQQKMQNISLALKMKCCDEINFAAVARQYGLSVSTFYHEWRKCFQLTPLQFIMKCRLEAGAELLTHTGLSIQRIVETVNFSGTYAFHCKFIEKYGETPGEYRKKHSGR